MIKTVQHESDLLNFARAFAKAMSISGIWIYLQGPLGAGKTTFARGFLQGLGYEGRVKSPTYPLVESYDIRGLHIYHFDFYRLQTASELLQLGLEDYFTDTTVNLVEWPDHFLTVLPKPDVMIQFQIKETKRVLNIQSYTERGNILCLCL